MAPINCPARRSSASKGTVPQMAALSTPEIKRLESVGSRTGGFDLMGAVRVRPRHANHGTQTVWVCVPRFVGITIKWMQGCADGASPPPLGDLFPPCDGAQAPIRSPRPQTIKLPVREVWPPSGREVPRYEAVGARRAYQIWNTFCLRTNSRSHRRGRRSIIRRIIMPPIKPSPEGEGGPLAVDEVLLPIRTDFCRW